MDDWEDDDWEAPDLNAAAKPAPESWSDEEAHDEKADAVVVEAPVQRPSEPKKKTGLELKIEEREAREKEEARRKAELRQELLGKADEEGLEGLEGEAAEKVRQRKMQEASDLDNAIDAFGLGDAPAKPRPATGAGGSIEEFNPTSTGEFEQLASKINDKIKNYQGRPGHMVLLKALLRATSSGLSTDEAKELSTFVSVLYNDKVKADREKDKKGKKGKAKSKASVSQGKAVDQDLDWGGGGGSTRYDDDDFM